MKPTDDLFIHYCTERMQWGRPLTSVCGLACPDAPGSLGPLLTTAEKLVDCPTCVERIGGLAALREALR